MLEKYNILIIEQDQQVVETIQDICSQKRFNIIPNPMVNSAIEKLKEGNFDLLILGMTNDDVGLDTLRQLHAIFPDVAIIAMGEKTDIKFALKTLHDGAAFYIAKKNIQENRAVFAYNLQLTLECALMGVFKNRLGNFAELNIHPIIELNTHGNIVYLNPVAATQFPDLYQLGLNHPLLEGLQKLVLDLLPHQHSEMVIFNREITFGERCFDQQIFVLPNSGVYIYIVDITERNNLRAQALLSDRLATVGTLAAGVAHEINNPISWVLENLRFLKNNIDVLKDQASKITAIAQETTDDKKLKSLETFSKDFEGHEKILTFADIIKETLQGAERIRDIVRDLKGFARIDKSDVTPVDVNTLLNTAISMAVPEFKYRARLEKRFASHLPPVFVNSGKLHQVFLNLVVNAAQAIPEGDIDNNKIVITTRLDGNYVRIDVCDTGQGISPEHFPKIFDPFFTTKPAGTGTGLGLPISHEVISKFGGEIKVKSRPNEGTTFSVFLPAHPESLINQFTPEEKDKEIGKINQKRVLIIDDEISLLKTMQRMLEKHHTVTQALGGQAGLEILRKDAPNFDVIICDLNMPNINGPDLYQFVVKNFPGLEQGFIFITAGVYTPLMSAFLEQIPNPIVEKPFTPDDLLKAIEGVPAANNMHVD